MAQANTNTEVDTILNRTSGKKIETPKVQSIVVTISKDLQPSFKVAVDYWKSLRKEAKKTLKSLDNLGKVLKAGKASVNNNNQVFSTWRAKKFIGMTPRFAQYAIQLHDNYKDILAKFKELNIDDNKWSNPESVMNKFNKLNKVETPPVETPPVETPPVETPPVDDVGSKVVNLDQLTPEDRIIQHTESQNMLIEKINCGDFNIEELEMMRYRTSNLLKVIDLELGDLKANIEELDNE